MNYARDIAFQPKLNSHLSQITCVHKDYCKLLSISDILELKTVLADMNNAFTYKTTMYTSE